MRILGAKHSSLARGPLTRQSLLTLIASEKKNATSLLRLQAVILLLLSTLIVFVSAFVMISEFYNAPISFSKRGWIEVRNLTPVVPVDTRINGVLEKVFVSQGQLVQKGALLGAIRTSAIMLDFEEAQQDFAAKIVELHCLVSLQSNKSFFKLSYDAQILVNQVMKQSEILYRVEQCERELLRNMHVDQSLEETIAALEDQSRLLENIFKMNSRVRIVPVQKAVIAFSTEGGALSAIENNQETSAQTYADQVLPMMQLAQARHELQKTRKDYFSRKLQKAEELGSAIEQTTQDIRYFDKRLRELSKQLDDNFIYASISGTVVGFDASQVGAYYKGNETVFKLQPIENEFQISVALDEADSARFKIGTPVTISLGKTPGEIKLTTVAVVRKPNGTLEAIMNSEGDIKKNADVILSAGYRGEGEQRIFANITSGQRKAWHSIQNIFSKNLS